MSASLDENGKLTAWSRCSPSTMAPKIGVEIVKSSEAPGGLGGPGTSVLAPAVLNAVYAATGVRLRKLPIDTEELKSESRSG